MGEGGGAPCVVGGDLFPETIRGSGKAAGSCLMLPYWLLFLLVAYGVLSRGTLPARQAIWAWRVVALLIALMVGLRHEVGGDWWTYLYQFERFQGTSFVDQLRTAKDPGYSVAGWLVAKAGGGIHVLNFICALPLAFGTVMLSQRQPRPMLALLVGVPYLVIVVGMGYTRQSAAIGCAMLGIVALGERRQWGFVLWILIAAAFHKSAILLVPIAALAATQNRILTYVWVAVLGVVGGFLFLYDTADTLVVNYIVSDYADASQGGAIRVFMNAVPSALLILFRRRLFEDSGDRKLWISMAIVSLACLPLLALSATAADRVALYFIPLQLVVFSRLPRLARSIRSRTLIVVGVVGYYAVVQFVWLNFASHAYAWLPYRFMPLW